MEGMMVKQRRGALGEESKSERIPDDNERKQ